MEPGSIIRDALQGIAPGPEVLATRPFPEQVFSSGYI
jgi:hypothetical protein